MFVADSSAGTTLSQMANNLMNNPEFKQRMDDMMK